jgi:hypothetical protein
VRLLIGMPGCLPAGSAPACDRMVGAQPDGTWRAVSPAQFRRICAAVVASIQKGQYDECAGRLLLRCACVSAVNWAAAS